MATHTLRVTIIVAGSTKGSYGNPDLGELYAQVMQRCPKCTGPLAPLLKSSLSKSFAASHYWKAGCFCVQCNLHVMPTFEIPGSEGFSRSTSSQIDQDDNVNGGIPTPPMVDDCPVISADSLPKNVRGAQKVWENSLDKEFSHFLACIKKHVTDHDKRLQEQQLELCRREKTLQVMSETVASKLQGIRQRENSLAEKEKRLFILKETIIAKDLDKDTSPPPFSHTSPRTLNNDIRRQRIEQSGLRDKPALSEGRHEHVSSWSHAKTALNDDRHNQVPALNHETLYHIRSLSEDSTVPPRSDFGSTDFSLANDDFQFDRPGGHRNVPIVDDISNIPPLQTEAIVPSRDSIYPDVFSPPPFRHAVSNGFADVKEKPDMKFTPGTSETASEVTSTNSFDTKSGTENYFERNTVVDSGKRPLASILINSRKTVFHDEPTRDTDHMQENTTRDKYGKQTVRPKLPENIIKPTVSGKPQQNSLQNYASDKSETRERGAVPARSGSVSSRSAASLVADFHSNTFPRNRNAVSRQPSVCLKGIVSNTRKLFENNTLPRNKTLTVSRKNNLANIEGNSAAKVNKDGDVLPKPDKKDRMTDKRDHTPDKHYTPDKKDRKKVGSSTAPYRGYRAYDGPLFTQKAKTSKVSGQQQSSSNTFISTEPPTKPPRLTSPEKELRERDTGLTGSRTHHYNYHQSKNTAPPTLTPPGEGRHYSPHEYTNSRRDIPSYTAKGSQVYHKATKSNITEYTTGEVSMPMRADQSRAWYATDEHDSNTITNRMHPSRHNTHTDVTVSNQEKDIGPNMKYKPTSPTSTLKKIQDRLKTQEEKNTASSNLDTNRSLSPERLEFWKSYLHQDEETREPPPRPPKYSTYSPPARSERNQRRETSDGISGNTWPKRSSNVRRVTML